MPIAFGGQQRELASKRLHQPIVVKGGVVLRGIEGDPEAERCSVSRKKEKVRLDLDIHRIVGECRGMISPAVVEAPCIGLLGRFCSSESSKLVIGVKVWKTRKQKQSVTLRKDINMEVVNKFSLRGLVDKCSYWAMGAKDVHAWFKVSWGKLLGYVLETYVLMKGWFCFIFKSSADAERVLQQY